MSPKKIAEAQFLVSLLYCLPFVPLSLVGVLYTYGAGLIVLGPLWLVGVDLMLRQFRLEDEADRSVWWYGLVYNGLSLLAWFLGFWATGNGYSSQGGWDTAAIPLMLLVFSSPLIGLLLSVWGMVASGRFRVKGRHPSGEQVA